MPTLIESPPVPSGRTPRLIAIALTVLLPLFAWLTGDLIGPRGRAAAGAICFVSLVAACSPNLRLVKWRTVLCGIALQLALALLILKIDIGGVRPGYAFFSAIAAGVTQFLGFTDAGSTFVFGVLADQEKMTQIFGSGNGMVFAFPEDNDTGFWMMNTVMPLSIAWFEDDGDLVSTADMAPCTSQTDCPTYPPTGSYRFALEVPQGDLGRLGVEEGSTIALSGDCA